MSPLALAVVLFVAAVAMILLDVFIPSGGVLLLLAFAAACASIWYGFQAGTGVGMTMVALVAAAVPILAAFAIRIWPHTPIGRRIVLKPPENEHGNITEEESMRQLIGRVVISEYPMMPANQLTIDHRTYNAIAETSFIEAGQAVEIVNVRQRQLVVRVTERSPDHSPARPEQTRETSTDLLNLPADELGLDSLE